jgi:pyruvate dehydrogenase E2 component (dihydrolipoamide acetyltransferase)
MATEFKLPELGENIESGKVTRVMVSEGDSISVDDPVVELETDKASLEVPSTVSGKVSRVNASEGDTVEVGQTIFTVDSDGAEEEAPAEEEEKSAAEEEPEASEEPKEEEQAPAAEEPEEEAKEEEPEQKEEPAKAEKPKQQQEEQAKPVEQPETDTQRTQMKSTQGRGPVPAPPSVRRLAREIGVDINEVKGSGPGGRITEADVKGYSRSVHTDTAGAGSASAGAAPAAEQRPLPDFTRWGEVTREELSTVRRRTAENMAYAWSTAPQVTQFDKADVTDIEALRKQYGKYAEAQGGKLTLTAILMKVLPVALKKFPQFNASLDLANDEIIYKHYYHIGVAVDTDRGLLVPVVRDCDKKSVIDISVELTELAERARNRKTSLDEMQGGTFTVSNLGGIGGTAFTPIVYTPQAAILGVARARTEPVYQNGQFVPRSMLPLSLSYDHRIIDGADGARFLRWICEAIEQPFMLFIEEK